MLTKTPTGAEIERTVHRTIEEVLRRSDREVPAFGSEDDIIATGLTSLDLASVVALLGREWQVDPFLQHRSITEVRTVGDLCRAYQACFDDTDATDADAALRAAQSRATRRRG